MKLTDIRVLSCSAPRTEDKFRRIAEMRGMPHSARVGMRVTVDGKPGVLVGANDSANFDVRFEGGGVGNCHPGWRMEFVG